MPLTKGSSGPTITSLISFAITAFLIPSKSLTPTGRLVAHFAVPAFPGAAKSRPHLGLCFNFQQRVCSRPPAPMTNTFIYFCFYKDNQYR